MYKVVIQNPTNTYILNKDINRIITLCSTKRPDLGHEKLMKSVDKAKEKVKL